MTYFVARVVKYLHISNKQTVLALSIVSFTLMFISVCLYVIENVKKVCNTHAFLTTKVHHIPLLLYFNSWSMIYMENKFLETFVVPDKHFVEKA